jgi:flavodoxin
MASKKCLVVYYSRTGNTRKVGAAIAEALGADVEEIVDKKDRSGALGFVTGARDAMLKALTEIGEPQNDPAAYDLVIIGTPVWAWTMCPAVRAYLVRVKDKLRGVAFFSTAGSTGLKGTFEDMAKLCGKEPAATLGIKEKELRGEEWRGKVREFAGKVGA